VNGQHGIGDAARWRGVLTHVFARVRIGRVSLHGPIQCRVIAKPGIDPISIVEGLATGPHLEFSRNRLEKCEHDRQFTDWPREVLRERRRSF
jgi:hypothetical protein